MRVYIFLILAAVASTAAKTGYPGDIVQYWSDQTSIFANGSVIGGLQSPPSGWLPAVVHGAIYAAAVETKQHSRAVQQLAISHAAHDALQWAFQGTRLYRPVDAALKLVLGPIGLDVASADSAKAIRIGRHAAQKVARSRIGDGLPHFVDYAYGPTVPPNYQLTPGGGTPPDNPQGRYVRLFGGVGDVKQFRASPPPAVASPEYEPYIVFVKEYGSLNSSVRTAYETDTAYYWRESSITYWNRFASAVVGQSLAAKPLESAKFYAQLNYALANAGFAAWDTKYHYDHWRPVTAIQRTGIWLPSKKNISNPAWVPLLRPTPSHQDYPSTHSSFGGAAAGIIRAWNGGDAIDITVSSNVTLDNRGVITRRYRNITFAAVENADSRVFGGIHTAYAGVAGNQIGEKVAKAVLAAFDKNWDKF